MKKINKQKGQKRCENEALLRLRGPEVSLRLLAASHVMWTHCRGPWFLHRVSDAGPVCAAAFYLPE